MPKVSIKGVARSLKAEDVKLRKEREKNLSRTADSLQNFAANLGIGTDTLASASTYGFNPITRIRTLLEWIHRGSWLGGVAIDLVAEDMTRAGVDIRGDVDPDDIEHLERAADTYHIWQEVSSTVKWSRLYGGAICVMLIDGQDMSTPLKLETVGKGQFKGLLTLDRWMVDPSLNDLVTEYGPYLGLPKYYTVLATAPAIIKKKIHYTRCLRLEGIQLSYWQRVMENLWGLSVIERLYDRMVGFDSATQGMAQLIYKAYLRVYKISKMREVIAAGGQGQANLVAFVDFMRRFQSTEGITLIDAEDDLAAMAQPSFSGLADAMIQLGQQLGGALQMPLTRLFGQSPVGMNATGENDLRTWYDHIKQEQNQKLRVPLTTIYRCMAQSEGIKLPEGFTLDFRSLWVLSDEAKSTIATADTNAAVAGYNAGPISDRTFLMELRQLSKLTGRWTNISQEDIDKASDEPRSEMERDQFELSMEAGKKSLEQMDEPDLAGKPNGKPKKKPAAAAA
jgi:phage-related protein (TIGR01555 family)